MLHTIALTLIPGIGPTTAKRLIAICGSAEAVLNEHPKRIGKIEGVGSVLTQAIKNNTSQAIVRATKEIEFITKNNIQLIDFQSSDYPQQLKHCEDSPLYLFIKGKQSLNQPRLISVVGTRGHTAYGAEVCRKLVAELAPYNATIVSGLALGIDTIAHKTALENNLTTIAVLGQGLDRVYPAVNKNLAKDVIENGSLVSEFLSESLPDKNNFPKRNRIVAGMCEATIVVETAEKGGSMITAELANSYSRDVFAVPGRLTDSSFTGCNKLIAQNKAAIYTSTQELVMALGWEQSARAAPVQTSIFVDLLPDEQQIVDLLRINKELPHDEIGLQLRFPASKLNALLLQMELRGVISALPGKRFSL